MIPNAPKAAGYGPLGRHVASYYDPAFPIIVADADGAAEAVRDAAGRKARGEAFCARIVIARSDARLIELLSPQIVSTYTDHDHLRFAFEEATRGSMLVNGRPLREVVAYELTNLKFLRSVIALSNDWIVSSTTERRRVCALLGISVPATMKTGSDVSVPVAPQRTDSAAHQSMLVWAPHMNAAAISGLLLPVMKRHIPISIVAAEQPNSTDRLSFINAADAAEALAKCSVILDLCNFAAEPALALAAWDKPLLVDVESGANELLESVYTYERREPASLLAALSEATNPPRPSVNIISQQLPTICNVSSGPLVSLVIPTHNRPYKLREALESVERQTYANIEAVVVNDAGDPLEELVAEFPRARLIVMPENSPPKAFNAGYRAARGEFMGLLCDDDAIFPDHVALLVDALQKTGGDVAYADVLTAFLSGSDGDWTADGLESQLSNIVDIDAMLVTNQIGTNAVLFRRSILEQDGWLVDESIPYCRDFALWLRLATRYDFIHVPKLTSVYTIRNKGAEQVSVLWHDRLLGAFDAIYAKYPVNERPALQARRSAHVAGLASNPDWFKNQVGIPIPPLKWPFWLPENRS